MVDGTVAAAEVFVDVPAVEVVEIFGGCSHVEIVIAELPLAFGEMGAVLVTFAERALLPIWCPLPPTSLP